MELSDDNIELYKEMVAQLAIKLVYANSQSAPRPADYFPYSPNIGGLHFWHTHVSDSELAAEVVQESELSEISSQGDFVIRLSIDMWRDNSLTTKDIDQQHFDKTLEAFIKWCGDYHAPNFPISTNYFSVSGLHLPTFILLNKCGYVDKNDTQFQWTDKVNHIMFKCGYWSSCNYEKQREHETNQKNELEAEVSLLIEKMPNSLIEKIQKTNLVTVLELAKIIDENWNGNEWRKQSHSRLGAFLQLRLAKPTMERILGN